ncbi:Zinc/iron permease [Xylariaceae sp. FL0804]|nr:Zinc/iron permease [Xylariaceae sp. FL0804]
MGSSSFGNVPWSSIPTDILAAELSRRQDDNAAAEPAKPVCGSGEKGAYDTPLHVFALFLILGLSTLACGFPLFSRQTSKSRRTNTIVFLSQHFGTGVLIATAFVHLLPTAFVSLTDPCLPYVFSQGYRPMAGLIAMVAALVVVSMESYLTTRGAGHSHSHHHHHGWDSDDDDEAAADQDDPKAQGGLAARRAASHRPTDIALDDMGGAERGLMADVSPLPDTTPTAAMPPSQNGPTRPYNNPYNNPDNEEDDDDLGFDLEELDPGEDEGTRPLTRPSINHHHHQQQQPRSESTMAAPQATPPSAEEQRRLTLQCMLLEAGILFHSVFIGMAVSVATGPPFVVFLVAIAFHQTFEGLALGSRIAAIQFPRASARPWLMVLAYGVTTPLGQAIGLAVHTLYDPKSQTGLLLVGFMNAISSGLLLFAGLVQLLAEDFLTEKSYRSLKGKRRRNAGLSVIAGALLMALVGAFA